MERTFKHPQIFADLLSLCQLYYPMHNNLPKPFRYAVGDRILSELAECLRLVVLANAVDKQSQLGRRDGAAYVRQVRAGIEVIRGFLLLGWKLKLVSHGALTEFGIRLEAISRQAARWQQWFETV
ncbi:four helix bundle protein [Rhodoferax sp. TBRC 17198]|uniref:four helix bundle protein n=1 Tax=Rhodoferax potami TaxID=3068338 RepID=UPI0028BECBCB|nr:four helix bundle protein [Rhodoferax sp. TBRC 17198]MDT7524392.1 four helix bundle protein [Rhodoferax sp. TBRC 17198]MDT7524483.1 four helix bundle protein [Rhodoferax sp. TBRC 17198]